MSGCGVGRGSWVSGDAAGPPLLGLQHGEPPGARRGQRLGTHLTARGDGWMLGRALQPRGLSPGTLQETSPPGWAGTGHRPDSICGPTQQLARGTEGAAPGRARPPAACPHFPSQGSCPQETRPNPAHGPPPVTPTARSPAQGMCCQQDLDADPRNPTYPCQGRGCDPPPHRPARAQRQGRAPREMQPPPSEGWPHSGARSLGGSEVPQTPALLLAFPGGLQGSATAPPPS